MEKAEGVILGLAMGDAMGAPAEFMSLDQIKRVYGNRGIRDLPDLAVYTDDTQMSIAIAEALIEAGHKDIETLMEKVKEDWIERIENKDYLIDLGIRLAGARRRL